MSDVLEIEGRQTGDYFAIVCRKCGSPTKNKYLGGDPAMPHFRAKCEKCNTVGVWKLLQPAAWEGLPLRPGILDKDE